MLYSDGIACCVVVGGKVVVQSTPCGIGEVDFKRGGCCMAMGWHVVF